MKAVKISTCELLTLKVALYHYLKTVEPTSVDLCLLLAPLHDGQSTHLGKYKDQTEKVSFIISVEAMVKGYQAYKDSWAAVLGEEMLCLREVRYWVNVFHM